jgi:hypothetical protein
MIKLHFTILIIIAISGFTMAQSADEIIGKYHLPNKLDIEIYKVNNTYSGKIIALNGFEEGQIKDINNPEELKRKDMLVGMEIIKNLRYDKDKNEWIDGNMYGPEKGMIFNLKITEIREKEIEVVGSKYFFWHTLEWERLRN